MKKVILTVALVALLVAAVFGGQALASSKSNDISISEETSSIWGNSYWGYPVRMKTFEGCFLATDYPTGYTGNILEESYPGIRHVSVTIGALQFNENVPDTAMILSESSCGTGYLHIIDEISNWENKYNNFETFEFNADNWSIYMNILEGSIATYDYAVTVTYPSNQW